MATQFERSRRVSTRTRVLMTAILITPDGPQKVLVRDLSQDGAQIYADRRLSDGLDACFRRGGIFVAARVTWCSNYEAGLKFYRTLSASEVKAAFHAATPAAVGDVVRK